MAVFSNQYWAVNREERWFCSLFAHSLLASSTTRTKFSELISDTVELGADRFEVYTEVAALRDYWNALGDPQKYTVETHEKRLATLLTLFKFQNLDGSMIESGFIWTSSSRKKLWSPGRWSIKAIQALDLDQSARQRFIDLKWAFNAKPDFLIRGGSGALLVEAKVESGLGTYSGGSGGQLTTQKLIKELMVNLIPDFYELDIQNCTFGARSENTKAAEVFRDYSWKELVNCLEESELDDFTIKSLSRLGN